MTATQEWIERCLFLCPMPNVEQIRARLKDSQAALRYASKLCRSAAGHGSIEQMTAAYNIRDRLAGLIDKAEATV